MSARLQIEIDSVKGRQMELTRRELLKGMAVAGVAATLPAQSVAQTMSVPSSFSSIDEIFEHSIVIDDLSGFDPQPSLPDAGFSVAKKSGITIVGPTLGDVEPEGAFHSTVNEIAKAAADVSRYPNRMMFIRNFSDIEKAKREKKIGLLVNVQNSACIERDLKNLDLFYDLGLR